MRYALALGPSPYLVTTPNRGGPMWTESKVPLQPTWTVRNPGDSLALGARLCHRSVNNGKASFTASEPFALESHGQLPVGTPVRDEPWIADVFQDHGIANNSPMDALVFMDGRGNRYRTHEPWSRLEIVRKWLLDAPYDTRKWTNWPESRELARF